MLLMLGGFVTSDPLQHLYADSTLVMSTKLKIDGDRICRHAIRVIEMSTQIVRAELTKEKPRGRPRDQGLEDRIFDAAIVLYAEGGWAAFNFDAVARSAEVGKAALYRRWDTRGDLLRETLKARWYEVGKIDTGSLRDDLLALARTCLEKLTGPYGGVALYLEADRAQFEEFRTYTGPWGEALALQARGIVRRAIARSEIRDNINRGLLIDVVVGGITMHVATTPKRLRAAMIAKAGTYVVELVDLVLDGAGYFKNNKIGSRQAR